MCGRNRLLSVLLALGLMLGGTPAGRAAENLFAKQTIRSDGKKYVYWIAAPEDVTEATPLIVYLHGSSERGDRALSAGLPQMINQQTIPFPPAVVMVPQLTAGNNWVRFQGVLMDMIRHAQAMYNFTDRNLVLVGFSFGATAVWNLVSENPGKFPRVMMISGRTRGTLTSASFADCDLRLYVGTKDENIPPQAAKKYAQRLIDRKYSVQVTELKASHSQLQRLVFQDEEAMAWLCRPIEPEAEMIQPAA